MEARNAHFGMKWYRRIVFINVFTILSGLGSSVSIATGYRLDGPESNPGGDETFRPSRPALGPTEPLVK